MNSQLGQVFGMAPEAVEGSRPDFPCLGPPADAVVRTTVTIEICDLGTVCALVLVWDLLRGVFTNLAQVVDRKRRAKTRPDILVEATDLILNSLQLFSTAFVLAFFIVSEVVSRDRLALA